MTLTLFPGYLYDLEPDAFGSHDIKMLKEFRPMVVKDPNGTLVVDLIIPTHYTGKYNDLLAGMRPNAKQADESRFCAAQIF